MTALTRYARLECPGLWREAPGAQRREVVVSLGDASLTLSDGRTDTPVSHWSLPAVVRMNPGGMPALYCPDAGAEGETLELDDPAMIEAIDIVRNAIAARRPHPGRLRHVIFGAVVAGVLALGVFWLPGALIEHAARVVPMAKRVEIGRMARADMERLTGRPCTSPAGNRALDRFAERLFGPGGGEIVVLRDGLTGTAHLPGRMVLLDRRLLERFDQPEVVAGHVVVERIRAERLDPLVPLLRAAGTRATLRLLTTGDLPETAVAGYGAALLTRPAQAVPDAAVIDRFAALGMATTPYALSLDPTGETVLGLIEADPRRETPRTPLLPDADWISLQAICAN